MRKRVIDVKVFIDGACSDEALIIQYVVSQALNEAHKLLNAKIVKEEK